MTDPPLISVLLGLPTVVVLVAVIAATCDLVGPLRRFSRWLVQESGGW